MATGGATQSSGLATSSETRKGEHKSLNSGEFLALLLHDALSETGQFCVTL